MNGIVVAIEEKKHLGGGNTAKLHDADFNRHKTPRCGSKKHASLTRPCRSNDTDCGEWKGRFFQPYNCHYEDISVEKATKCLKNRTIACIGDSMTRDICIGLTNFLLGVFTLENAPETKFDGHHNMIEHGDIIEDFDFWMRNVPPDSYNGFFYPKRNVSKALNIQWQVQIWSGMYTAQFLENGQIEDVLNNRMATLGRGLRTIDIAFWNLGLHDYGWFMDPPHGYHYFKNRVHNQWLTRRDKVSVPTVWMSMNPHCVDKMVGTITPRTKEFQAMIIEEGNKYANAKLLEDKLPYWDAGAPLRSAGRCEHSADGVHTKMYASIMTAKMLLNHLCDGHGNWRGSIQQFI